MDQHNRNKMFFAGIRKPTRPTKLGAHIKPSSSADAHLPITTRTPPPSPILTDTAAKPCDNAENYRNPVQTKQRVSNYIRPGALQTLNNHQNNGTANIPGTSNEPHQSTLNADNCIDPRKTKKRISHLGNPTREAARSEQITGSINNCFQQIIPTASQLPSTSNGAQRSTSEANNYFDTRPTKKRISHLGNPTRKAARSEQVTRSIATASQLPSTSNGAQQSNLEAKKSATNQQVKRNKCVQQISNDKCLLNPVEKHPSSIAAQNQTSKNILEEPVIKKSENPAQKQPLAVPSPMVSTKIFHDSAKAVQISTKVAENNSAASAIQHSKKNNGKSQFSVQQRPEVFQQNEIVSDPLPKWEVTMTEPLVLVFKKLKVQQTASTNTTIESNDCHLKSYNSTKSTKRKHEIETPLKTNKKFHTDKENHFPKLNSQLKISVGASNNETYLGGIQHDENFHNNTNFDLLLPNEKDLMVVDTIDSQEFDLFLNLFEDRDEISTDKQFDDVFNKLVKSAKPCEIQVDNAENYRNPVQTKQRDPNYIKPGALQPLNNRQHKVALNTPSTSNGPHQSTSHADNYIDPRHTTKETSHLGHPTREAARSEHVTGSITITSNGAQKSTSHLENLPDVQDKENHIQKISGQHKEISIPTLNNEVYFGKIQQDQNVHNNTNFDLLLTNEKDLMGVGTIDSQEFDLFLNLFEDTDEISTEKEFDDVFIKLVKSASDLTDITSTENVQNQRKPENMFEFL